MGKLRIPGMGLRLTKSCKKSTLDKIIGRDWDQTGSH